MAPTIQLRLFPKSGRTNCVEIKAAGKCTSWNVVENNGNNFFTAKRFFSLKSQIDSSQLMTKISTITAQDF